MKTITVTFPIEEAMALIRLARAESRCLIENGDVMPDGDVVKRAQHILSARERMVSELEDVAAAEKEPAPIPAAAMDLTKPNRPQSKMIDDALRNAVTRQEDGGETLAELHGVPCAAVPLTIEAESMEEAREKLSKLGLGLS